MNIRANSRGESDSIFIYTSASNTQLPLEIMVIRNMTDETVDINDLNNYNNLYWVRQAQSKK